MSDFSVEAEAGELGFDQRRLARIDAYLRPFVDDGRLPGWLMTVSRRGKLVHLSSYGERDKEAGRPVTTDTVWRLYSMTKPITSVAAMMLCEEGALSLTDPVAAYLPAFADMRVFTGGSATDPVTEPARTPITVWHLLTHTAGLTYGFLRGHPVDSIYRAHGFEWGRPKGYDLAACCDAWAAMPLQFEPGTGWNYSVATDVLGRVVEVVSGLSLDAFLRTRIFEPLGMTDTAFHVGPADTERLAALYVPGPGATATRGDFGPVPTSPPRFLSGGGGLHGTAADYHRFARMLLGRGELDGVRLLGSRTVDHMTRDHLPAGVSLKTFGNQVLGETAAAGSGFGLGFGVLKDPVALRALASPGQYAWAGAATTLFWVDPVEEIIAMFFTQMLPIGTYPLRTTLGTLVQQALVD
ncbi:MULTISPECIES: serine hydrolase domain-containing protein [Streptomycetaceae]|nr:MULTISPECIES: serine hydrolase domain-containing protein [Streptomycetaceae]MYS62319.1 serine hydrolase [Streptomyces sp. SID5468]CCB78229.1 Beta-lactamase [Streptantibioticus cattleyicolor NRRL 8057 = DSM 46488]